MSRRKSNAALDEVEAVAPLSTCAPWETYSFPTSNPGPHYSAS